VRLTGESEPRQGRSERLWTEERRALVVTRGANHGCWYRGDDEPGVIRASPRPPRFAAGGPHRLWRRLSRRPTPQRWHADLGLAERVRFASSAAALKRQPGPGCAGGGRPPAPPCTSVSCRTGSLNETPALLPDQIPAPNHPSRATGKPERCPPRASGGNRVASRRFGPGDGTGSFGVPSYTEGSPDGPAWSAMARTRVFFFFSVEGHKYNRDPQVPAYGPRSI